jgi:hypothetical protein
MGKLLVLGAEILQTKTDHKTDKSRIKQDKTSIESMGKLLVLGAETLQTTTEHKTDKSRVKTASCCPVWI